jgi:hypothetical protein
MGKISGFGFIRQGIHVPWRHRHAGSSYVIKVFQGEFPAVLVGGSLAAYIMQFGAEAFFYFAEPGNIQVFVFTLNNHVDFSFM